MTNDIHDRLVSLLTIARRLVKNSPDDETRRRWLEVVQYLTTLVGEN